MVVKTLIGNRAAVLGVIFAGGASRRFGSDKALALLDGRPLLARVMARIRPQVDALVISGKARGGFAVTAIPDLAGGAGPLVALCAVLAWAESRELPLVATFACDTPFIPLNCVDRLREAVGAGDCAVASGAGAMQPTCALWRSAARQKLESAVNAGERSLHRAIALTNFTIVDFPSTDGPAGDPFYNINSRRDMEIAQVWLHQEAVPA